MALTNAERQQRFRERHGPVRAGVAVPVITRPVGAATLTEKQVADRAAVIACSLLPLTGKYEGPLFMGMGPQAWVRASDELVDHFGMRAAKDRWDGEWKKYLAWREAMGVRAKEILAEVGSVPGIGGRARKLQRDLGDGALCRAYDADPTLKRQKLVT